MSTWSVISLKLYDMKESDHLPLRIFVRERIPVDTEHSVSTNGIYLNMSIKMNGIDALDFFKQLLVNITHEYPHWVFRSEIHIDEM